MTGALAVVGMACRFPGAPDLDAYWQLLRSGREGLTRFTDADLDTHGVPRALRDRPRYVPVGGLIDDQDRFDPAPFGLTDAEAALLDPQQRLFLQSAWHALEHAGHLGGRDVSGAGSVGVFAGSMQSAYLASNLAGRWDPTGAGPDPLGSLATAMATQPDYLPLQVAYRLDLTGPAVAVASSCSTSLVAVHLAAQSLLAGECDTALAGGVSLIVPQGQGYLHVPDGVFSADGTMRPFGAGGTGIVYTQGVGVVVLRRLADALASGDDVLAVLHGTAVNNDGADKAGFTAPSVRGQARAVAEALAVAGVEPAQVGMLEAHGTATPLGDPIELAALRRVFGDGPAWCGLGSVKGNIGHTNSAAGVASLIKTVLALQHRTLPATLHAEPVNPALGLEGSPFALLTGTRPWSTPPHAGVSSFGIGGTNAHAVLGPAPQRPAHGPDPRPALLVVSAATAEAARATAEAVTVAGPDADVAHTLAVGRRALSHRVAAVGAGLGSAPVVRAGRPRLLVAFPGAGSPYPGMGGQLHRTEPVFADAVDECAELLAPHLGTDVRDALDPGCPPARIADPGFGLPALFAVSYGLAQLFASWGARPDALVGHSLGECVAAAVSRALPLPDAARLVAARCLAASRAATGGAMLAVALDEPGLAPHLAAHPDLDLAAVNAPGACTVSGPATAVDALAADLASAGVGATRLRVAAAMHSRVMDSEQPALRAALAGLAGAAASIPVHSTVAADADLTDPEHWVRQLRTPVRFSAALRAALDADHGRDAVLLELGPGTTLCGLARRHADPALRATVSALPEPDGDEQASVRTALGVLWTHGAPADPATLSRPDARRTAVPGYAFERRRLWIDPPAPAAAGADPRVDTAEPLQLPGWELTPPIAPDRPEPGQRWRVAGHGPLADALRRALPAVDSDNPADMIVVGDELIGGHPSDHLDGRARTRAGVVVETVAAFGSVTAALPNATAARLLLVTRGGERVGTGPAPDPAAAALRVLPRVLGQERPALAWTALDLDPAGDTDGDTAAVLAEASALTTSPEPGALLARRGDSRWRRTLTPWSPARGAAPEPGTVLITGGLGAVGRTLAEHLADRGHRVVVTTRSDPATVDPVGGGVNVRRCDATDPAATTALLAELSADGPLAAVLHAAAVIAGAQLDPLRALDADRLAAHVHAKLGGALALRTGIDALPPERRPRAVVLMSSVVTLVGGVGTAAYAAATAAMDAVGAGAGWSSVVWDGWRVGVQDTAMAGALDATTGAAALDRILTAPAVRAVSVATTDLRPRIAAAATPRPLGSTASGGAPRPADGTVGVVAEVWSELFGTAVTDPESDFFALGGHSLLGTRMLLALRDRCGVELRLRDLLESPTVAGLAARIEDARPAADAPTSIMTTSAVPVPSSPSPAIEGDGTFPMTRVQHAYWVGRGGGYEGGDVPCWFALAYGGALDVARLEEAWNAVVARHPMLRAVTTPEGRFRVVDPVPRYRIRVHDLSALTEERRGERLATLWTRVATRPGPSDRWPLATLQAALLPGGRVRVLVGVDVLVCDAASWWIIESELQALYRDPAAHLPAPAAHPAAGTAALELLRAGPDGERAAAYWRARTLPGPPALPVDPAGGGGFVRRAHRLAAADWAALRAAATRHRVTPAAVLLTAFTDELARWSGTAGFSVVLTRFDRPAGFDGVVGDFTSLVLHEVPGHPASGFARRAAATQARLFADLDHRAHSAIDVLAEQSTRTGQRIAVPVVFTSALDVGHPDALEWMGDQVDALSSTPQTWLDHQVLEVAGELRLQWDSPDGLLPAAELDAVVARHADRLRELAREPRAWQPGIDSADIDSADIVLPLHSGSGARPVLALMHPSGGDVLCYTGLARALDDLADVVAVTDPQLAGIAPDGPETVPGIAAHYLDALRAAGHRDPWLLGGWSMGGTVAQEMAVQAHEAGERVALLAMLDSNDPTYIVPVPGADAAAVELEVTLRHLRALEAYLGIDLDTGPGLVELPAAERAVAVAQRLRGHRLLGRGEPDSSATARAAVFARHLRALAAHTPRRHPDPGMHTLLVRADRTAPRNSGIGMGVDDTPPDRLADLGWGAHLAGPLHVVDADAHHYGLLHPPALTAVAAAVRTALTTALDRAPALLTPQRTP